MLTGVISEQSLEALRSRLASVPDIFDAIEIRFDAVRDIEKLPFAAFHQLIIPKPAIFTLRPKDQGGAFAGDETTRLELLEKLASLCPACIDVEYTTSKEWVERIKKASPTSQIILSYHDFERTPSDLEAIRDSMLQTAPQAICKIATMANSTLDALRMLVFCKESRSPLIGICMGEHGSTTRILAPVVHTGFSYCPVTNASAPGQIAAETLSEVYNFKQLNPATAIYGLLGDPVDKSIGHQYHNERNRALGVNAVYVKWQIHPGDMAKALPLFKKLAVKGLSVTMPLKEEAFREADHLDDEAAQIGAVNTLVAGPDGFTGYNTDARGAVSALTSHTAGTLQGSKVAVLGAGGSAKAIIHELKKQGATVLLFNRSPEKAEALGVPGKGLEALATLAQEACQYVVNTLPITASVPLTPQSFVPGSVAMDITYMGHSSFLDTARHAGCICIDGLAMYSRQADLQRKLWGQKII